MAVMDIVIAPDPVLKKRATEVDAVDDDIRVLMDDMLETMYHANGIGLAAPQVAILKRVIVVDVAREGEDAAPLHLANPEVIWASEELNTYDEGCLSLPQHYAEVTRPKEVKVKYLDRDGVEQVIEADGLLATCIQHEIDHLNGTLFVDHLSSLKRNMIISKLRKTKKQKAKEARDKVPA